jgi:hypothetical protein
MISPKGRVHLHGLKLGFAELNLASSRIFSPFWGQKWFALHLPRLKNNLCNLE